MKKKYLLFLTWVILSLSITVAADENGNRAITLPNAGELVGTEARLLPSHYDIWSCAWSPDGKNLAFAGKLQGEVSTRMRIWIWPFDPATYPAPFTNTENLIDYEPCWSPDGKQLAMIRVSQGKTASGSALWIKQVPGGEGRQLTNGNQDRDPSWSPDGTRIVLSRGNGPYQAKLITVSLVDGDVTILSDNSGQLLISPWWGNDGKIYFTRFTPFAKTVTSGGQSYQVMDYGKGSIWTMNPLGGDWKPVVVDEYDNRLPTLSPDGTMLAFVSDRYRGKDGNGKYDRGSLYVKNLLTGEIRFVTNKVGLNGGSLSWSPDGKKLAFFTYRSIRPSVWVINLAPSTSLATVGGSR